MNSIPLSDDQGFPALPRLSSVYKWRMRGFCLQCPVRTDKGLIRDPIRFFIFAIEPFPTSHFRLLNSQCLLWRKLHHVYEQWCGFGAPALIQSMKSLFWRYLIFIIWFHVPSWRNESPIVPPSTLFDRAVYNVQTDEMEFSSLLCAGPYETCDYCIKLVQNSSR